MILVIMTVFSSERNNNSTKTSSRSRRGWCSMFMTKPSKGFGLITVMIIIIPIILKLIIIMMNNNDDV